MQVKLNTLPATLAEFQALPKAQTTAWPRWICCVVPVP